MSGAPHVHVRCPVAGCRAWWCPDAGTPAQLQKALADHAGAHTLDERLLANVVGISAWFVAVALAMRSTS